MKEKYLKKIEETKKRLEELEKLFSKEENKKWKPEKGEKYYYITNNIHKTCNCNMIVDNHCISIGNYFKTEEEAEFEIERLKVLEEMKEFSYEFSEEEWEDEDINKHFIYYDYIYKKLYKSFCCRVKSNNIYFKSEEDIQKCIDKIGKDRLIKYYFKVGR